MYGTDRDENDHGFSAGIPAIFFITITVLVGTLIFGVSILAVKNSESRPSGFIAEVDGHAVYEGDSHKEVGGCKVYSFEVKSRQYAVTKC